MYGPVGSYVWADVLVYGYSPVAASEQSHVRKCSLVPCMCAIQQRTYNLLDGTDDVLVENVNTKTWHCYSLSL